MPPGRHPRLIVETTAGTVAMPLDGPDPAARVAALARHIPGDATWFVQPARDDHAASEPASGEASP